MTNLCYGVNGSTNPLSFQITSKTKIEILSRGRSLHADEKRDVTIRVRRWTKEKLKTMDASGNDNDDMIFMLIDFWEQHHKDKK